MKTSYKQLRKIVSVMKPEEMPVVNSIHDLKKINGYEPLPSQLQAHESDRKFILFGGAMGGGKSAWLVNEMIFLCLKYPGIRVFLCRHELSSFKKSTYMTLRDFIPWDYVEKENKSENFIEFINGSRLLMGSLGDDLRAIQKLKSMEISAFGIDEASDTTENFFFMLSSRLRQPVEGVRYKGLLTSNPCSNWIRKRFLESAFEDHLFVPALPAQNSFLYSGYIEDQRATLPEDLFKAWMLGDWNVISDVMSLFSYDEICEAMNRNSLRDDEVVTFGVDVARYGDDLTVISSRSGNVVEIMKVLSKKDLTEISGEVMRLVRGRRCAVVVDTIGVGSGVADILKENGVRVIEFVASGKAKDERKYRNARAEAYFNLKDELKDLQLPKDEKLRSEMISTRYRVFSDGRLQIEEKSELKKRLGHSPDRLDSILMACYTPIFLSEAQMKARLPVMIEGKTSEKELYDECMDEYFKDEESPWLPVRK